LQLESNQLANGVATGTCTRWNPVFSRIPTN
jgi:hypothetical protein